MNAYFNTVKNVSSQDTLKGELRAAKDAINLNRRRVVETKTAVHRSPPPASSAGSRVSAAKQTAQILKTLKNASNPVTHSSLSDRSDYVSSCSTGHEKNEKNRVSSYFEARNNKLRQQETSKRDSGATTTVLKGVRVYLGFCDTDTDIEMRRIVSLAGGTSTYNEAGATHIVTSQWLSGKKIHKFMTTNKKIKVHVVSPAWVHNSIEKEKRQSEWKYRQMESGVQRSVLDGHVKVKS